MVSWLQNIRTSVRPKAFLICASSLKYKDHEGVDTTCFLSCCSLLWRADRNCLPRRTAGLRAFGPPDPRGLTFAMVLARGGSCCGRSQALVLRGGILLSCKAYDAALEKAQRRALNGACRDRIGVVLEPEAGGRCSSCSPSS